MSFDIMLLAVATWGPTPKAGKACRFLRNADSIGHNFSLAGRPAGQEVQHHLFEFSYIEFERPSSLRMVCFSFNDVSQVHGCQQSCQQSVLIARSLIHTPCSFWNISYTFLCCRSDLLFLANQLECRPHGMSTCVICLLLAVMQWTDTNHAWSTVN
jgi:hypothetical protein